MVRSTVWMVVLMGCGQDLPEETDTSTPAPTTDETTPPGPNDTDPTPTDTGTAPTTPTEPWLDWPAEWGCVGAGEVRENGETDPVYTIDTILDLAGGTTSTVKIHLLGVFPDRITTNAYVDVAGLHLLADRVYTGAYVADEQWTYGAAGEMTSWTKDEGSDGVAEYTWSYTWDGPLLTGSALDLGADGVAEVFYTGTYDAEGRLLTWVGDIGQDGEADEVWTHTWSSDTMEDVVADLDGDGEADRTEHWEVDADGRSVLSSVDSDADGDPDQITTWSWTAEGWMATQEVQLVVIPASTRVAFAWTYDEAGRVVTYHQTTDALDDGLIEYTEDTVTDWTCRP